MKKMIMLCFLMAICLLSAGIIVSLPDGGQVSLYSDYYALIIGNSDYQYFPRLKGVKQDVWDIKALFEKLGIASEVLENLPGDQLSQALMRLVDIHGAKRDRGLILYFAGHGYTEKAYNNEQLGYIIGIDAPLYDKDKSGFRQRSVSMNQLRDYAKLIQSKHVLMIFDSCFSGSIFRNTPGIPKAIDDKVSFTVRQFITAGDADEEVPDQSVFKATLVKGLGDGFADLNQDGFITGDELGYYLSGEVANYSNNLQHPRYGKLKEPDFDRGDFVFALAKTVQPKKAETPAPTPVKPQVETVWLYGNLEVETNLAGDLYLNGDKFQSLAAGQRAKISKLVTGDYTVELRTSEGNQSKQVSVKKDQTQSIAFKFEKMIQPAVVSLAAQTSSMTGSRKALVIGNADYGEGLALKNPVNDATEVAAALIDQGFSVTAKYNLALRDFNECIDTFVKTLSTTDEVVFYYSGFGAQEAGENYLIPINSGIGSSVDLKYKAISASWILENMNIAKLTIFVLDASRNFPIPRSTSPRGLAKPEIDSGKQYVIFAAGQESIAQDGDGQNSPFAEFFVRNLRSSPKKIEDMMKDLRSEVRMATSNMQIPTAYGILNEDFYFIKGADSSATMAVTNTTPNTQSETELPYIGPIKDETSLRVTTDLAGDLYLNGDRIQSLSVGQTASFEQLTPGDHTLEIRTPKGNMSHKIKVQEETNHFLNFNFNKDLQEKMTSSAQNRSSHLTQHDAASTPAGMVYVEGGSFNMGSYDEAHFESPIHQVSVSSFYISKYEITQKEWRELMITSSFMFKGEDRPVEQVSWYYAIEYCNYLSIKQGLTPCYRIDMTNKDPNNNNQDDTFKWIVDVDWKANGYRLLTEAEWEYAARGGNKSKGYKYSGSNDLGSVAWYNANSYDKGQQHQDYGTHKVGSKAANELGIYDMSGNVWEWCWDWYDSGYYAKSQSSNPTGANSGSARVLRGGGWYGDGNYHCRITRRGSFSPNSCNYDVGFRVARSVK